MSHTRVIPMVSARAVLRLLAAHQRSDVTCWSHEGTGFIGWGRAQHWDLGCGSQRIHRARHYIQEFLSSKNDPALRGFASITFDPDESGSVALIPEHMVSITEGDVTLTSLSAPDDIVDELTHGHPDGTSSPSHGNIEFTDAALTSHEWAQAVSRASTLIRDGQVRKLVLTRDLRALSSQPLSVAATVKNLIDTFPSCFTFALSGFVGSTPELLLRQQGTDIESIVLAGSRPRGQTPLMDERNCTELLTSEKDQEEHRIAVESLTTSLTPLTHTLELEEKPSTMALANVWHLATHARGTLTDPATTALDVVAAIHPTSAVCGTPTHTALDHIRSLEKMKRGRYTGPVGWMDAEGNGEWGIALRCAQIDGESARLFAGAGIMEASDPASELAETEAKFNALRGTLSA